MRAIRRFSVQVVLPDQLSPLDELARNLRWFWDPATRALFERVDADLWARTGHDPLALLAGLPATRLAELARDESFVAAVHQVRDDLRRYLDADRWYQQLDTSKPAAIGYFSPEFGVTGALPQYSGGLGILAGDHLKAASDLGVPVIGVGLFYRSGYFRQSLDREGWQQERYPVLDPDDLPLELLRDDDGSAITIRLDLPGDRQICAQVLVARVGRVPLLLLNCDIEDNAAADRRITDRLYGGGSEHRLLQEMVLGIGGVRAIRAFCERTGHPAPEVFHSNEGHAGFLGLERIRELMGSPGLSFDAAREAVSAGTVFTTHTPVPAGIDRFPGELVATHFGGDRLLPGVPLTEILELGAESYPGGEPGVFNMAVMGLRLARFANGVSRLHGRVSREMFAGLWPGFDGEEIPIGSITNGVHAPTWIADQMQELIGPEAGRPVAAAELWDTKRDLRRGLVADARRRLRESWLARGLSEAEVAWTGQVLAEDVLTIGFARRAASYKRLTLMLRDEERLRRLLLDPERPVQILIAGKAHPADDGGKALIQQIVRFADREDVRHRIVFLPDYDIEMARTLYPGCDVWLNTPMRPMEACGTSGMKAALNGALNLSVRDGWWDEWFDGRNGWAIPTAGGVSDPERRDELESAAMYDLIEHEVIPAFYQTDADGRPQRWLGMLHDTMTGTGPKVLASRMVAEYVTLRYQPARAAAAEMAADNFSPARELAGWRRRVRSAWPAVAVEHVESDGAGGAQSVGALLPVRAYLALPGLGPDDVAVQAVSGRVGADDQISEQQVTELSLTESYPGNRHLFSGRIPLDRTGPFGYTVRIVPRHRGLASVADLGLVTFPGKGL